MRFGVCVNLGQIGVIQDAGYDYCELAASQALAPESPEDEALRPARAALLSGRLVPETFNLLLPSLRVTGPDRDAERLRAYMTAACARAAAIGGKILVFGSGSQRRVPEEYPVKEAWSEIRAFLTDAADAAEPHGIEIAIEPLNSDETNIITSVNEALDMADDVNRPASIGVLADLYHIQRDGESFDGTVQAARRGMLRHVHVACGDDRHAPRASDREAYVAFFEALKSGGYDSRVSIEAGWTNIDQEAAPALAVLRDAWNKAA